MASWHVVQKHKIACDLHNGSRILLRSHEESNLKGPVQGGSYFEMSCAIMQAFCVEALINYVGNNVRGDSWPELKGWKDKLKLLIADLELGFSFGSEPIQTITKIMNYRNELAHGKPVPETSIEVEGLSSVPPKTPSPFWFADISLSKLQENEAAIEEFRIMLLEAAGISAIDFYISEEASWP